MYYSGLLIEEAESYLPRRLYRSPTALGISSNSVWLRSQLRSERPLRAAVVVNRVEILCNTRLPGPSRTSSPHQFTSAEFVGRIRQLRTPDRDRGLLATRACGYVTPSHEQRVSQLTNVEYDRSQTTLTG